METFILFNCIYNQICIKINYMFCSIYFVIFYCRPTYKQIDNNIKQMFSFISFYCTYNQICNKINENIYFILLQDCFHVQLMFYFILLWWYHTIDNISKRQILTYRKPSAATAGLTAPMAESIKWEYHFRQAELHIEVAVALYLIYCVICLKRI